MKILLLSILVLLNQNVLAQQKTGFAFDKTTKIPISNATIWSNSSTSIVIADSIGLFKLNFIPKEKFFVSHIGYAIDSITENFKDGDTIFLKPKIKKDEDVIVYGHKNYVAKNLGSLKKKKLTLFPVYTFHNISRFFSGKEYKDGSFIKNISLKIFKPKHFPESPEIIFFKVEIFTFDSIKNTIEEILEESEFVPYKNNTSKVEFDLEKYNIKLPKDGFFVCVKSFREDNWKDTNLKNTPSPLIEAIEGQYDLPPKLMYLNKIDRIQLNVERYVPKMLLKIKSPK